jgi:cytochrome c
VVYPVKSASVSADAQRVFLEIADLKVSHVVYLRLLPPCYSVEGEQLWATETWFTLNALPADRLGEIGAPPEAAPQNYLTVEEQAAGWRLLFDGQTTNGWRGYRKDHFPAGWVVKDGCLTRVGPGGDICTGEEFDSFELQIEWRIGAGGNSGIFFRVDEKAGWAWETGPEFQVLDNSLHADGGNPLTSAGADYALHAPVRDVTAPVASSIRADSGGRRAQLSTGLNDVKIVE